MRRQEKGGSRDQQWLGKRHKTRKQVIIRGPFPITGQEYSWGTEKSLGSRHFVYSFPTSVKEKFQKENSQEYIESIRIT